MSDFFLKGDKVFRSYIAVPEFIYGGEVDEEDGVVIGGVVEFEGKSYLPAKWESSPHPSLDLVESVKGRPLKR